MRNCRECNKQFDAKGTGRKFCDVNCLRISTNRRVSRAYREAFDVADFKDCRRCGKPFKTFKRQIFCSTECRTATALERTHKPRETRSCLNCNAEFESAHKTKKYCCLRCMYAHHQRLRRKATRDAAGA